MPRTKTETVRAEPEGLLCRADFISGDEERKVLDLVEGLEFGEVTMRGESASAPSSGKRELCRQRLRVRRELLRAMGRWRSDSRRGA